MVNGVGLLARASRARERMLASTAVLAVAVGSGGSAWAEQQDFTIQPQAMGAALVEFAQQADIEVLYDDEDVADLKTEGVTGASSRDEALGRLLEGSGLRFNFEADDLLVVRPASEAAARDGRIKLNAVLPDNGGQLAQVSEAGQRQARAGDTGRLQVANADLGEDDGEADMEEMIVLGSNIRGARNASPVFTFSREDIEITGASTLPEFIQTLPQNFGGGVAEDTQGGVVPGGSGGINFGTGINLRGLGNDSTLTLFNGRRLAPVGSGNSVDISMIPLVAIERVEVLTDGASAIYGSDAVGGVVNFTLRDDYEGAETRFRYGTATSGDLDEIQAGQVFGTSWNTGNALISYEYYQRDNLDTNDRDFARDAEDPTDLLPRQARHSAFFSGRQGLGGAFELFGDAFFSTRDSDAFGTRTSGAPIVLTSETDQFGASLGSGMELSEHWRGNLVGAVSRSEVSTGFRTIETSEFTESLGGDLTTWTVDGKVDGPLLRIAGREIRAAFGGHYRHESILFFDPVTGLATDDNRDVYALFGEVNLPLVGEQNQTPGVNRLELTVAARYEHYSDFGSTVDPKVGALWSPIEGLNFRGTWGTSFRAPLLRELDTTSSIGFLVFLPDPASSTGSTLAVVGRGGNPDLGPEEATTWTAGFDFELPSAPMLNISVTYFDIDFDDRIQPTFAAFSALTDPIFEPLLNFSPDPDLLAFFADVPQSFNFAPGFEFTDAEVFVDERNRKVAGVRTRGIDFDIRYDLDSEIGAFGFAIGGAYLFEQSEQLLADDISIDVVDTVFNPPELRLRGSASWQYEGFTSSLTLNYVDDYVNDLVDPSEPVDSWTTVDLFISYNTGTQGAAWIRNTTFSFSTINVFDEDPPLIEPNFNSINYDATNANPRGRTIAFQVIRRW